MTAPPLRSLRPVAVGLVVFGAGWLAFRWLFQQFPYIQDLDSYYHLAVARLYAHAGTVDVMPWARFSVLQDGFGDKEFLFHWALAPFAGGSDPASGGRWALAFWNSLAIVVLGALGVRAAGRWGLLVPCLLWAGSIDFVGRMVRLRPETPAMLLLVLAAWCFGTRRFRWLGVIAFVFTLGYTAFHALLGLVVAWFLWHAWRHRKTHWLGLAYPFLGVAFALLVHPHFPHNLLVWKIQSVDFFQYRQVLDVGSEIEAATTESLLRFNLGWLAGFLLLAWAGLSRRPDDETGDRSKPSADCDDDRSLADTFSLGALAFGGLLLLGRRFATHALPFLLLALLFQLRAHGRAPGRSLFVPTRRGQGRCIPAWPLVAALVVGCLWTGGRSVARLTVGEPETSLEADWGPFSRALPVGAKVAATWGHTHLMACFAPHAQFLNVLDPVFMAVPFPEIYETQRQLFDSRDPDVPLTVVSDLDSEYLALVRSHQPPSLLERLRHDPRVETVHEGGTLLFRMRPAAADAFVVDWRQVPAGTSLPVGADEPLDRLRPYPLAEAPTLRSLEAFVDARRFDPPDPQPEGRCRALVRQEIVDAGAAGTRRYELAPWGPTTLWLDDRPVAQVRGTMQAYLGRGIEFSVDIETGVHRWTALTCRGESMGETMGDHIGFYLRRR